MDIGATVTPATNDSKADDEAALQDFYTAMDGPNWDDNTGWSSDSMDLDNAANIFGVEVREVNGENRVDELNLSGGGGQDTQDIIGNGLSGSSIPDSFRNLKQMRQLRLKGNDITARIDNWVQSLTSIVALRLSNDTGFGAQEEFNYTDKSQYNHAGKSSSSYNKFTGPIPNLDMLTNLELFEGGSSAWDNPLPSKLPSSLQAFVVSNSTLSGSLPAWDNLTSLTHLYLNMRYADTSFNDDIPSEWNSMDIYWLYLEGNTINSFPEMPGWTNVRQLTIAINGTSNTLTYPAWLFDEEGKNLSLHTLKFGPIGSLPATIGQADPHLGAVHSVADGNATGNIPAWAVQPAQQLQFQNNNFSSMDASIEIPHKCKLFWFSGNQIEAPLPESNYQGNGSGYIWIYLQNNQFHGQIPASWSNLNLTSTGDTDINLSNNNLEGVIPQFFADIEANGTNFRVLNLSNNKFTPKDILPYRTEIEATGVSYTYTPQKPFTAPDSASVGDTIDLSSFDYTGNTYQWYLNDVALSGETSSTLDTTSHGAGTYKMEIDHPDINYTFTSEEITVS